MEQTAALIVYYRAAVFITAKDLSGLPLIMSCRLKVQSELESRFGNYYDGLNVLFILISNYSLNFADQTARMSEINSFFGK